MSTETPTLNKKDFQSDQDVRWCPGCGDYSILSAVQTVFAKLGFAKEKMVVISGIGCSSRFPYYMDTYGFHTIHGRAPAFATGLKVARPDLHVWVATGDGDAMSIGGNHLIHLLRRNVNVNVLLFNNRIYGLTKGQYSPTSEEGKRTKSSPAGSVDHPFNPLALALGSGASFVARTVDIFQPHMREVMMRAQEHKGTSFIEIYQNCNIFNDKAFTYMTDKPNRADNILYLEHGKPMLFGVNQSKGIRLNGLRLEVVELGGSIGPEDCLVWDEDRQDPAFAFLMAQMTSHEFPTPIGVFRAVAESTYDEDVLHQLEEATTRNPGKLEELIYGGDTWTVESPEASSAG